jgi:hypothetical protein
MQITNVRRHAGQPIIALFDIEHDGLNIYDVALRRNGAGEMRVFAPSPNSRRIVTFDRVLADAIIREFQTSNGSLSANGQSAA